jgi:hypothetical protein
MALFTTACFVLPVALGALVMEARRRLIRARSARGSKTEQLWLPALVRSKRTRPTRRSAAVTCSSASGSTGRCSPRQAAAGTLPCCACAVGLTRSLSRACCATTLQANKDRLGVLLSEVQNKKNGEERYRCAP